MSASGERTYQEGSEQPNVGTDPMQTPQQDEKRKKQVAPDPKKTKEAERQHEDGEARDEGP